MGFDGTSKFMAEPDFRADLSQELALNGPLGQAGEAARKNAGNPTAGGLLGQRALNLSSNVIHTERFRAASVKLINASDPAAIMRARFDESEWFDVFFDSFISPGFRFDLMMIRADRPVVVTAQYGASFIG